MRTIVPLVTRFVPKDKNIPSTTDNSEKIIAVISVFLKPKFNCILARLGITIRAETSKIPTTRIQATIRIAVKIANK